jgi:hypothetical protein
MKKLIGLLGAAGLLIPSAAMAGSITNSVNSDAIRLTGAEKVNTTVDVTSNIRRDNNVVIYGQQWGESWDTSAESFNEGDRHYDYATYDYSDQSAARINADIRADGHFSASSDSADSYQDTHSGHGGGIIGGHHVNTVENYEGQDYAPASDECTYRWHSTKCTHTAETPEEPTTVVTTNEGVLWGYGGGSSTDQGGGTHTANSSASGGGGIKGFGQYEATRDGQGSVEWGYGEGFYANGSISESFDEYETGYTGRLKEKGLTTTTVGSKVDGVSSENGFQSGSSSSTDWN